MKLAPYPEYKETDVSWLGNVPAHWEVRPLRTILKQRNEKNNPIKVEQILSLSITHGVTLYSHEGRDGNKSKSDLSAYKIAHTVDIVLNSMNVIVGAVGLSKYTGAISPVYYALYPRTSDIDIHYYDNIFSDAVFQRYLIIYGKGILIKKSDSGKLNTIRMKISPYDLKGTFLPLPSHDEQIQIARFLNWKTTQINKFIRNKRRLVELLKEQKQNIINQAVTRGLDPNVKLKPSGVEWIGDIPEHWEVIRLKHCISRIEQGWSPQCDAQSANENEWGVLKVGCVNGEPLYKNWRHSCKSCEYT
jgi:type I restriction enzyme, S subunit